MLYLGNKYKKRRQINHKFLILYNIKKTLISQIHTDAFCVNQCQSVGLNLFSHKFHKYTQMLSVLISANLWDLTYSPTNFTNTHRCFLC